MARRGRYTTFLSLFYFLRVTSTCVKRFGLSLGRRRAFLDFPLLPECPSPHKLEEEEGKGKRETIFSAWKFLSPPPDFFSGRRHSLSRRGGGGKGGMQGSILLRRETMTRGGGGERGGTKGKSRGGVASPLGRRLSASSAFQAGCATTSTEAFHQFALLLCMTEKVEPYRCIVQAGCFFADVLVDSTCLLLLEFRIGIQEYYRAI